MRFQAVEFLADVEPHGEQRDLLLQAFGRKGSRREQIGDLMLEPLA